MQPLVSIIIPVYNSADYLEETILSALEQTWQNKEIIIVNDGSTDDSLLIAKKREAKNVKVFSQTNKGASAARNVGIRQSKGDFIQFLDGDDLLAPNKIATQLAQLTSHSRAVSICPIIHFEDMADILKLSSNAYEDSFLFNSNAPFDFMLNLYGANNDRGSMIPIHSWLTPAKLINAAGLWDETLTMNDDGEFFCRVALQANQIFLADNTACYYRKHRNGTSLSNGSDEKSLASQYRSILKRSDALSSYKHDDRINIITVRSLMALLVHTYPRHKALTKKISKEIESSGVIVPVPVIGGPMIEFVKKIIGWKLTRMMQTYYASIFKK